MKKGPRPAFWGEGRAAGDFWSSGEPARTPTVPGGWTLTLLGFDSVVNEYWPRTAWISPLPGVASCRSRDRPLSRRWYRGVEGRFLPTRACA